MATITDTGSSLDFDWPNDYYDNFLSLPYSSIEAVSKEFGAVCVKFTLDRFDTIYIKYEDVTAPVTANIDDLIQWILDAIQAGTGGGGGGGMASSFAVFRGDAQTPSEVYARVAAFPFPGTSVIPTVSKITALVRRNGAATSASIRIYDATNANVIAEATGITTLDDTLITDLGAVSNLPAGAAAFEIQLLKVGGPGGARAFCSGVEFRI
jgi:hypothetical protein